MADRACAYLRVARVCRDFLVFSVPTEVPEGPQSLDPFSLRLTTVYLFALIVIHELLHFVLVRNEQTGTVVSIWVYRQSGATSTAPGRLTTACCGDSGAGQRRAPSLLSPVAAVHAPHSLCSYYMSGALKSLIKHILHSQPCQGSTSRTGIDTG